MMKFYEEIVGLEVLRQEQDYVFFRIAAGYAGHTQNLALFDAGERSFLDDKSIELSSAQSTLHHIAFNIALEDFGSEKQRLEGFGLRVHEAEHAWIHLRSLYFSDPEGNTLEFVAHDDALG
jgi:catechol-2,3-dioxygenase